MAKTAEDYAASVAANLPPGTVLRGPVTDGLMLAYGDGYARIDTLLDDLLPQADPRDATDLLTDWEDNLGLPDPCVGQLPDLASRAAFAFARHTDDGGQSRDRMKAMALQLGYAITIVERWQRQYGDAMCGTVYGAEAENFVWEVHAPAVTQTFRLYGSALSGGPYSSWGNTALACELNKIKPAHTVLVFVYDGD